MGKDARCPAWVGHRGGAPGAWSKRSVQAELGPCGEGRFPPEGTGCAGQACELTVWHSRRPKPTWEGSVRRGRRRDRQRPASLGAVLRSLNLLLQALLWEVEPDGQGQGLWARPLALPPSSMGDSVFLILSLPMCEMGEDMAQPPQTCSEGKRRQIHEKHRDGAQSVLRNTNRYCTWILSIRGALIYVLESSPLGKADDGGEEISGKRCMSQ